MSRPPSAKLASGWFGRFRRAFAAAARGYTTHGTSQQAAAIAFRVLFSLVPLVALLVAVVDLLVPVDRREEAVDWIVETLSGSTGLEDSVRRALRPSDTTASIAGLVALVGLIWAATGMMSAIRRAFQTIWEGSSGRSYVRGKLSDVAVVLGTGIVALLGFGLGIVVQAISEIGSDLGAALGSESTGGWLGTAASAAETTALTFVSFIALYRVLSPVPPRWKALWPGALVGTISFEIATFSYGAYLARFSDLNAVYGSFGAVLGFLLVV